MARAGTPRRWLVLLMVLLVAPMLLASGSPASAHASGQVPIAELSADGDTVHVDLLAPADDAAAIGTSLGYLGEGAMLALLGGPDDDLPTPEQVAALSRSAALRDYLETHVSVHQDGVACEASADAADDFLADGARIAFACPAPVERAEIAITVLHDLDPAYRTFSIDGTDQYAIHSAAAPEHTWDFTRVASRGVDSVLWMAIVVVAAGIVATVATVGPRRAGGPS